MAIIDGLVRLMYGTSRSTTESALKPKELAVNEESDQPEANFKKHDSSGYIRFPSQSWLNSYIDGKGGAREIGLEDDDDFNYLTGDQHLQSALKAFDAALKAALDPPLQSFTIDVSGMFDTPTSVTGYFQKVGERAHIYIPTITGEIGSGKGGVSFYALPVSGISAIAMPDDNEISLGNHLSVGFGSIANVFNFDSVGGHTLTVTRTDGNNFIDGTEPELRAFHSSYIIDPQ